MSIEPDYKLMLHTLPPHMHHAILGWIEHAEPLGDFLTALLSNDLMEAFSRADNKNVAAMRQWVDYLYNYAPSGCYGSPQNVVAWWVAGGQEGIFKRAQAMESKAREQLT